MTTPARPVIAFLSDFGTRDHYVAAMKGVVLEICPDATLVDLTHDIEPQDVLGGALELAAVAPYFPPHTVFVAVVDPGVGTPRRALAVARGAQRFVGPDNGLLWPAVLADPAARVVGIDAGRYMRPDVSRTFEGRDRFAPAGAWLARGVTLEAIGSAVSLPVRLDVPAPTVQDGIVSGIVLRVDRFGNLVTNIPAAEIQAGATGPVEVGGLLIDRVSGTYGEARDGALCALVSSSGHLEVAVRGGSAAAVLRLGRGAPVHVHRR